MDNSWQIFVLPFAIEDFQNLHHVARRAKLKFTFSIERVERIECPIRLPNPPRPTSGTPSPKPLPTFAPGTASRAKVGRRKSEATAELPRACFLPLRATPHPSPPTPVERIERVESAGTRAHLERRNPSDPTYPCEADMCVVLPLRDDSGEGRPASALPFYITTPKQGCFV